MKYNTGIPIVLKMIVVGICGYVFIATDFFHIVFISYNILLEFWNNITHLSRKLMYYVKEKIPMSKIYKLMYRSTSLKLNVIQKVWISDGNILTRIIFFNVLIEMMLKYALIQRTPPPPWFFFSPGSIKNACKLISSYRAYKLCKYSRTCGSVYIKKNRCRDSHLTTF